MSRIRQVGWLLVCAFLLSGCQTAGSTDPASIAFRIPTGSKLVLHKELTIPEGRSHIMLQHGQVANAANEWDVNCRFEVRDLGPRAIHPDSFLITRYSSQRAWVNQPTLMRFYKEFHLQSETQPDIMPMVCQDWADPMMGRPVTVQEVEEALGGYFSFEFAPRTN